MLLLKVIFLLNLLNVIQDSTAAEILLTQDVEPDNFGPIYKLTQYFHKILKLKGFVTFADRQTTEFHYDFMSSNLEQNLVEEFQLPVIVCGMECITKLRYQISIHHLIIIQFTGITDAILNISDSALEGLHNEPMIYNYGNGRNSILTVEDIHEFFEWCWRKNSVNVILMFKAELSNQIQIYDYKPFPVLTVRNLTEDFHKYNDEFESTLTTSRSVNVNGYIFITPVFNFFPYVILSNDCISYNKCEKFIQGTIGRYFTEYIKKINGVIKIIPFSNLTYDIYMDNFVLATSKKKTHIGVNPASRLVPTFNRSEHSYPIAQSNVCIIVPLITQLDTGYYFKYTFDTAVWGTILLLFIAIFILQIFMGQEDTWVSFTLNPIQFCSYAILNTLSMIFNHASVEDYLLKHIPIFRVFYVLILFMISLVVNMYLASMTSMLSSDLIGKQIDTVEDFLATELEIMIGDNELRTFFDKSGLPAELKPRIGRMESKAIYKHLYDLNTSYAYTVTAEQWGMVRYQQRRLRRPLFRQPSRDLCAPLDFLYLRLQWDSPFKLDIARFALATQESGLAAKWWDMSIYEARQMNVIENIVKTEELWETLTMHDFDVLMRVFLWLQSIAILCFLIEVIWYYCVQKNMWRIMMKRLQRRRISL